MMQTARLFANVKCLDSKRGTTATNSTIITTDHPIATAGDIALVSSMDAMTIVAYVQEISLIRLVNAITLVGPKTR